MDNTRHSLFKILAVSAIFLCCSVIFVQGQNQSQDQQQNQVQQQDNKNQNNNELNGEQHKSTVSTFVQNLLDVANKESGIGDQVKAVATEQEQSKEKVADAIDKVKNRNTIKTFLFGTDYKNIGQLRSEMVTTDNSISKLKTLLGETTSSGNQAILQSQITSLEQEQTKINNFITTNESKFSLLGWLVKLFSK